MSNGLRHGMIAVVCSAIYALNACGQPSQTVPSDKAKAPQTPTSQPTTRPAVPAQSAGDPVIDKILDRLEEKGRAIQGLECELVYQYITVFPVEDRQVKEGSLLFARMEPNPKFFVEFKKITAGGVVSNNPERFVFDGVWLTERNDKAKTIIKRQVVRPGEKVDLFEIGKGPFPLPFGQKRQEILRLFKVTLKPFEPSDPPGSHHLHCIPQANSDLADKYNWVDIFVDKTLDLPVRIVSERVSDENRIQVDFKAIDTHAAPAGSRFQIETPSDFTVTVEPLEGDSTINLEATGK